MANTGIPRIVSGLVALALASHLCLLGAGCNTRKMAADMTAPVLLEGAIAMDGEADLMLAREAFPATLKTIESFLVSSPDNQDLLLLLARGYNSYAFGFIEGDLERAQIDGTEEGVQRLTRRAVLHYLRGRDYALRLLDRPRLEKAVLEGDLDKLSKILARLDEDEVPALFWATYGWGSAANLAQGDVELMACLPSIERMMDRVIDLGPGYAAGLPLAFQGVYYASKPKIAGGDPEKARAFFEQAMEDHGDANLLIPYLYGRYVGTQTQDRAHFDKMMKKVLEADLREHPALRLTNEVARERARFWAARADQLILE
jgi:hypothetical protein